MQGRRSFHANTDIVILLDATGSMGWCRDEIVGHVCSFADDLARLQHHAQLALYVFRDLKLDEPPRHYPFTQDPVKFQAWVRDQKAQGGGANGGESSFDALLDVLDIYRFRDGAGRFIILFTDEPPHEPTQCGRYVPDIVTLLQKRTVISYVISDPIAPLLEIANSCGGLHFNIRASRGAFRPLFLNLSRSITAHTLGCDRIGVAARAAVHGDDPGGKGRDHAH